MTIPLVRLVLVACLVLLPVGALAQTEAPVPTQGEGGTAPPTQPEQPRDRTDTHMFGVLPNYATVDDPATAQPITARQKLKLAQLAALDPIVYPFAAFSRSEEHTSELQSH